MSVEHVVTYFIRMHTHVVSATLISGCKNVKLDKFEIKKNQTGICVSNVYLPDFVEQVVE